MDNITAEAVIPETTIELWVRIEDNTTMFKLAVIGIENVEALPESENDDDDTAARYWARRVYDQLGEDFGFDQPAEGTHTPVN